VYIPGIFAETDETVITRFVDTHPLATLVGIVDGRPMADHLPFVRVDHLIEGGVMASHVAKANPTWRLADESPDVLLIFSGADAYISPSLYPTKRETHEVVPTYNYISVHVHGRLTYSHEREDKLRCVSLLTQRMEHGNDEPWSVTDAPERYIQKMLEGIVAINLEIQSIQAKIKASQNRVMKDQIGVLNGLRTDVRTIEAANVISARIE
jgi:transcriptional regulator